MTELRYYPVLADVDEVLSREDVVRILVFGDRIPASIDHRRTDTRFISRPEVDLPIGIYRFSGIDEPSVLLVARGSDSVEPTEATWDAPDEAPLIAAYGWFVHGWEQSDLVPSPQFQAGDQVETVPEGQEAQVRGRSFVDGAWTYRVRLEGRTVSIDEAGLTTRHDDDDPYAWVERGPGSVERFAATLTRRKLAEQLTDTVFSFRATKTIFRPYQFRPVVRLLETGSFRLLIADEVGLGKTIEAGLVWTELDARGAADRVLVVCPSMLLEKWRAEMDRRFGFEVTELDRGGLEDLLDRVEEDRLPKRYHVICSVERLRGWSGLERLGELAPSFDLVIADEAHVFRNTGTKSNALGAQLSEWADALVFLSATPLNLGNDDLYNLLELLAPGEFEDRFVLEQRLEPNAVLNRLGSTLLDRTVSNAQRREQLHDLRFLTFGPSVEARPEFGELVSVLSADELDAAGVVRARRLIGQLNALSAVVSRTRKVDIQEEKAFRAVIDVQVAWTAPEAELYQRFDEWQRNRARQLDLPVGFVIQMPLRLASTCLPAARSAVLEGRARFDELEADGLIDAEGLVSDPDRPPDDVVAAARALPDGVDTKFDAFVPKLEELVGQGKRVLVFTFSRPTLAYLRARLSQTFRVRDLHGGVKGRGRQAIMAAFRAHEFDVLLASRVASEGLDFEFCSAVVNYDLPWNPMEVEQRIGRIDRFGQVEDKVFVVNFHTPGTIETDIVERVHDRIGVFKDSIGELEPILQAHLGELRRAMFDFRLTEGQRKRRIDEILAAVEERRLTKDEVEAASAFLASTDRATIDGFEDEVLSQGRYVGQEELALLVRDWVGNDQIGSASVSNDGRHLRVAGSAKLAQELMNLNTAGERSMVEVEGLARTLRDEGTVNVCLDQELARVGDLDLLTANHPFVRAALRVPGDRQTRFAEFTVESDLPQQGRHLVLFSVARWKGVHDATEIWTSAVRLDRCDVADDAVGGAVLAALAAGRLREGVAATAAEDVGYALQLAIEAMTRRQVAERTRRRAANDALLQVRRLSLEETFRRKRMQIQRRIDTITERGGSTVRMHRGQLARLDRNLDRERRKLDQDAESSLTVEDVAVAAVTLVRGSR